jgi:hypothetical protein
MNVATITSNMKNKPANQMMDQSTPGQLAQPGANHKPKVKNASHGNARTHPNRIIAQFSFKADSTSNSYFRLSDRSRNGMIPIDPIYSSNVSRNKRARGGETASGGRTLFSSLASYGAGTSG